MKAERGRGKVMKGFESKDENFNIETTWHG